MARADEYIAMLDDPEAPAPAGVHASDEALLQILIQVACSDGVLQDQEQAFLLEILPGHDTVDLLNLVAKIAAEPMSLDAISRRLGSPAERAAALRFAARLAWSDEVLDDHEETLLRRMAGAMGLTDTHLANALDRVLHQPVGAVSAGAVAKAVEGGLRRAAVEPSRLFDNLSAVVPSEAVAIARVLVDGREAIGLYDVGMAASFVEGDAFVAWNDIAYFTRVPMFGVAARIVTHADRTLTIGDRQLADIGQLLERVFTV